MDIREAREFVADWTFAPEICARTQKELVALRDGELMPAEVAAIEAHLAVCPQCTACRDEMQATLRLADALPTPTPVDVADAVLRYIADETPEAFVAPPLLVSPTDLARARAKAESLPFIDLNRHAPEPDAIATLTGDLARKYRAIPVRRDGQTLFIAMADPRDINAVDHVKIATPRYMIRPMLAEPDVLDAAIERAYPPPIERLLPAAPLSPLSDMQALLAGMQALQTELAAVRAEMTDLRRQLAAGRDRRHSAPPRPGATDRFTPYALYVERD